MTTQDMLDRRYGRTPSPRRRWTVGIFIAIAAAGVAIFAWMTVAAALDDVNVDTTGFTVDDARTVSLSFQITAPTGRDVACVLEAQDAQHGIVGWKVVRYAASDVHAQAFRETIPTTAEATTGLVNTCWVT
jgi:hypothetical protein